MSTHRVHGTPSATFGVLTDIQYADVDDKPAWYDSRKTRYYRAALKQARKAFDCWTSQEPRPSFVLQLGDLIDGVNNPNTSHQALHDVLNLFARYPDLPVYHTLGNHELYNFPRSEFLSLYKRYVSNNSWNQRSSHSEVEGDTLLHYSIRPTPGLRVISLDCFDVSILGCRPNTAKYKEAENILKTHHKHHQLDLWDIDERLQGLERRFLNQNGAVSREQLEWLNEELSFADEKGEKVIVFGHLALHPQSADATCLLWNYEDVLSVFHQHSSVLMYIGGHAHVGGYACDEHGIHYVILHGIIETSPEIEAFATVSVFENKIVVVGHGVEDTRELVCNKRPNT